jgi:Fur family transcriptional regulator, ferric uptake regulator
MTTTSQRQTRSQVRILELLRAVPRPISAQDLYLELRQQEKGMGLATVYRSLEALRLSGSVQSRSLASGEAVYSLIQEDRHHLTCLRCGQSLPIDDCPVHSLEHQLNQTHQFKIYYHTLEFYGLCQLCQASAA